MLDCMVYSKHKAPRVPIAVSILNGADAVMMSYSKGQVKRTGQTEKQSAARASTQTVKAGLSAHFQVCSTGN